MYITKIVSKHIEQVEVADKRFCDICKQEIKPEDSYDRNDIRINAKVGPIYPEGDQRDGYIIDCCAKCFLEKLKPLIENAFGVKFRKVYVEDNRFETFGGW